MSRKSSIPNMSSIGGSETSGGAQYSQQNAYKRPPGIVKEHADYTHLVKHFAHFREHQCFDPKDLAVFSPINEHALCIGFLDDLDNAICDAYDYPPLVYRIDFYEYLFPHKSMVRFMDLFDELCSSRETFDNYMYGFICIELFKAEMYRCLIKWNLSRHLADESNIELKLKLDKYKREVHIELKRHHDWCVQMINRVMAKVRFTERFQKLLKDNDPCLYPETKEQFERDIQSRPFQFADEEEDFQ
jgi:hypothetical protein